MFSPEICNKDVFALCALKEGKPTKKKRWMIPLILISVAVLAFCIYVSDYSHADEVALKALVSDESVLIERTGYGWFFDGPSTDTVFVFYPGGKVEETAYAPMLHEIAEKGMDVCLIKMPFRLAVLGSSRADGVLNQYDYEKRYIGGHSLGAVVAGIYAAKHDLDGVIMFAGYPDRDVDEPMLMIYGSEDGIISMGKVAAADQYGTVKKVIIEGGNHAGFGNYGDQKGDGHAGITAEEQQAAAIQALFSWIKSF